MNSYTFILIALILTACSKKEQPAIFQPQLIAICVSNLETSIEWYESVLGAQLDVAPKEYPDYGLKLAFLKIGDFRLELIEKDIAYHRSEILRGDDPYLGGLFKLGFVVPDIEATYQQLLSIEGLNFVAKLQDLPENTLSIEWASKHFLLEDPDGNYIQFFDTKSVSEITLWLSMITVENLDKSIIWYKQNIEFTHHQTVGNIGNRRAILERNGYVLELFEPSQVIKESSISIDSTILGFKKIAFGIDNLDKWETGFRKEPIEIVMPPESSDVDWATQAMMIKDQEGNLVQFFELKD